MRMQEAGMAVGDYTILLEAVEVDRVDNQFSATAPDKEVTGMPGKIGPG